jgi:solute carrier family 15 (oligopeptide transporter), member 1
MIFFLQTFLAHKITEENTVYIMWLLPQFIVMTAAEIMFSITSLQFSYTQVPLQLETVPVCSVN